MTDIFFCIAKSANTTPTVTQNRHAGYKGDVREKKINNTNHSILIIENGKSIGVGSGGGGGGGRKLSRGKS